MRKIIWLLLVIAFPMLEVTLLFWVSMYLLVSGVQFGIIFLFIFIAGIIPPIIVALYVKNKRAKTYLSWKYEAKFSSDKTKEYLDLLEEHKKKRTH